MITALLSLHDSHNSNSKMYSVRIDCLILESVFSIDSYLDLDLECNSGSGILNMLVRRRQLDYSPQHNMSRNQPQPRACFFSPAARSWDTE